ncbi:cytochrome P450 3A56-like [Varroa jacobsoni]|uniref:cytochrome P450 3A56-like n=1 Tax=Varroa jacobsoni TaxID=62625 RepID=UPI000BF30B9F|nr:cytochrome P450 3A56-like [Varroa jacobsoni]
MWPYLLLVLVALLIIKLINVCLFWSKRGLPYESWPRHFYRLLWLFNTRVISEVIRDDVKKYGTIYGTYRGLTPSLMVADAEIAKEVLIKQFGSFFGRTFEFSTGDALWDNTLTHLPYDQWKAVRTVMGYTFTSSKIKGMIPKFDKVAKRYGNTIAAVAKSNHNEIDLKKLFYNYSMDSIVAVSFGIDLDCLNDPDNDFVKYGTQILRPGLSLILAFTFPSILRYLPFAHFPPKGATKFFGNIGKHILAEKKKNLDEVIKNGTADILDLHLIAQKENADNYITDEVLASQAFLFFIGGIETSAITLQLCTYFLATNPEVQDQVYDEVKHIMGERTEVHYDDVQKMKLLEACLLESLRIVPITFSIDRIATEDTEVAGIAIKKGMIVEFPIALLHHDPKYFPEPDKFIPERFLKDEQVVSETSAFLTFGDGPKSCIGRRLALILIQVLMADILLKVRFDKCSKTPVPLQLRPGFNFTDIFLMPLILRLTPRQEVMR